MTQRREDKQISPTHTLTYVRKVGQATRYLINGIDVTDDVPKRGRGAITEKAQTEWERQLIAAYNSIKEQAKTPLYKRLSAAALHQLKLDALDDPWAFADLIHFYGGTSAFEDIHKTLVRFLRNTPDRRLVLMPRGHFKSTICSTLYVLWRIYRDPNIRIMVGTALKELATGFVREVKQYLEDQELQYYVWNARPHISGNLIPDIDRTGSGRKRGKKQEDEWLDDSELGGDGWTEANDKKIIWRANAIQVNRTKIFKEPTVFAASVGVVMTGWHYDLAIFDDVVTYENSRDIEKAKKVLEWTQDIESVLNPRNDEVGLGDEIVILGTRYYKWDYYGHLMGTNIDDETERQEFLDTLSDDPIHLIERDIYGNGADGLYHPDMERVSGLSSETGYMCPRLMDIKKEKRLRRRLKARKFASQYLNQIVAQEDVIFTWDSIKFVMPQQLERDGKYIRIRTGMDTPPNYVLPWCVVDPAASLKESADLTVISVGGVDEEGNLYCFDTKYGHWTSSQLATNLQTILEKWNLNVAVVEANGTQVAIVNTVKEVWQQKGFQAHIIEEIPRGDKKQKILDSLEPHFEENRIYFSSTMAQMTEIKEQLELFPAEGARDDFLDTLEKIKRYARPVKRDSVERRKLRQRRRAAATRTVNAKYGGTRY